MLPKNFASPFMGLFESSKLLGILRFTVLIPENIHSNVKNCFSRYGTITKIFRTALTRLVATKMGVETSAPKKTALEIPRDHNEGFQRK